MMHNDFEELKRLIYKTYSTWIPAKASTVEYGSITAAFFCLTKTIELIEDYDTLCDDIK